MVIDNQPIFETCLIKTNKKDDKPLEELLIQPISFDTKIEEEKNEEEKNEVNTLEEKNEVNTLEEIEPLDILNPDEPKEENIYIDFEDLIEDIEEKNDVLREINNNDLNLDDNNDLSITLKKPNQVYFELYKEARNKAKEAKKNAILAYLEAKNIKKTYMIENINDSDSDFDAEIDEVSESELEGL
jgi:hypothetical protein